MNSMMEPALGKVVAGRLLILDAEGSIVYYRPEGHGDRLGPLHPGLEAYSGEESAYKGTLWVIDDLIHIESFD